MSYTAANAITETRYLINENNADFWSDTEIEGWIKEATIDVSCKLLSAEAEGTIDIVDNQWIYTSDDESWIGDLLKIKGCYYEIVNTTTSALVSVAGLQRVDMEKFGHLQVNSGKPRYFMENNRSVYIYPIPTSTEEQYDIEVLYAYETDDVTALRDEHQSLTFLYAASKAKMKDRLFEEANFYMSQYLNSISFERKDKYDFGVDPTSEFDLK